MRALIRAVVLLLVVTQLLLLATPALAIIGADTFYIGSSSGGNVEIGRPGTLSEFTITRLPGAEGRAAALSLLDNVLLVVIAAICALGTFIIYTRLGPVAGLIAAVIGILAFVFLQTVLASI